MENKNQYQNIAQYSAAMSMPKKVVGIPMQPKYMDQHGVPLQLNIDSQPAQYSEDILPPPSPVSSSYSELRRATENPYPTMPIYPSTSHHPQHTYANIYQSDYTYASYQPSNLRHPVYRTPESVDHTQISSPYESIYEPINSRPPSQMSNRSNYPSYSSSSAYANGGGSSNSSLSGSNLHLAQTLNNKPLVPTGGGGVSGGVGGGGGGVSGGVGGGGGKNVSNLREAEVDVLTELLVQSMNMGGDTESFGICVQCGKKVIGEGSGCTAMEQIYHIECFTCCQCQINLQGKPFYALDGKPCCEEDYLNTLEKCSVCVKPILERILRANGKPYHPKCFCCVVCGKSLDGVPFTVDATNQNHCIEDFHKKFAPRCCVCKKPIMPAPGQDETVRVVALDRSFHVQCYKCEDCDMLLSSEAEGRGCYPLDDHILCKACNAKRVQMLTSCMTTEL